LVFRKNTNDSDLMHHPGTEPSGYQPCTHKMNITYPISVVCIAFVLLSGCQSGPEVIHDLSESSFTVLNQDSTEINFPQDFKGKYTVVGFIYTHCPDVCPVISAKLGNVNRQLPDDIEVQFVQVTFDPKRDTPSVLKKYMENFKLNKPNFTAVTGDSVTIDTLLGSMDIVANIAYSRTTPGGKKNYFMNHTNRILLMDKKARVRYEYPGSAVKEQHIIDDLNKL